MWRPVGVARDVVGPTSQHGRASDLVPAKGMGQTDSKLSQPLPEATFGIWGSPPAGLQDLVGLERAALVQQPLSLNQTFVRCQDKIIGNTDDSRLATAKGASKFIARAGVTRTTAFVAISINAHGASWLPFSSRSRKPASSRITSPSSCAFSALEPAFSPTTT